MRAEHSQLHAAGISYNRHSGVGEAGHSPRHCYSMETSPWLSDLMSLAGTEGTDEDGVGYSIDWESSRVLQKASSRKNILWTADLNSYPKSTVKLSLRCKTHCTYPKGTLAPRVDQSNLLS